MSKTILLTGATDGIGLETAKELSKKDVKLFIHGRNIEKLENTKNELLKINPKLEVKIFKADLSSVEATKAFGKEVLELGEKIDVLINNAGVFVVNEEDIITKDGFDVRFAVNTFAPYILTKMLLPLMDKDSRVINLSSAAQASFDEKAFYGGISASEAYAMSKLGIIMWGLALGLSCEPSIISVNPKSFLGSKMVKTAYGRRGYDLKFGSDILCRAALSNEFEGKNGAYYDNDIEAFASPHRDGTNIEKCKSFVSWLEQNLMV